MSATEPFLLTTHNEAKEKIGVLAFEEMQSTLGGSKACQPLGGELCCNEMNGGYTATQCFGYSNGSFYQTYCLYTSTCDEDTGGPCDDWCYC